MTWRVTVSGPTLPCGTRRHERATLAPRLAAAAARWPSVLGREGDGRPEARQREWGPAALVGIGAVGLTVAAGSRRRGSRRGGPPLAAGARPSPSPGPAGDLDAFDSASVGVGALAQQECKVTRNHAADGGGQETRAESFRYFLTKTEELGPLWYRSLDSFMTALGTVCFVTSVVEPAVARTYHLNELEDIVNVSFFVKFALLFWTNDFEAAWLFTGKGALDLASCLPVLCIPARFVGGPALERTADLLQIGRFLRLLRAALPSDGKTKVPLGQQLVAVLLSLFSTVVVSATVLFSFENPTDQAIIERSFEDTLVYMVNIFAGRDPPWYPSKAGSKLASVVATCCGIIFIPFLVSRSVEVFMPSLKGLPPAIAVPPSAKDGDDWAFSNWVAVLRRLDMLENTGLLSPEETEEIRRLCLEKDDKVKMLDMCYGPACSFSGHEAAAAAAGGGGAEEGRRRLYAARLRELLAPAARRRLAAVN